ncbi:MAG: 16S rRNA (cytosine(1402)-N(4))-methyltransferase RsmH [Patescibacteria group bacterium]
MHLPVLQEEVVELLNPQKNANFIDCTVGEGGHAKALLEMTGPQGKLLGLDWDPAALKKAEITLRPYGKRVRLVHGNYAELEEIAKAERFSPVHGVLFDLGLSSNQLEESERGFSFKRTEPLDMRFNPENPMTASKIVNYWNRRELEGILKEYGEERFARRIAEAILISRGGKRLETTADLVRVIEGAVPGWYRRIRTPHFAQRTFQALRIAVNGELDNLLEGLSQATRVVSPGGRIAVISFHSLEDRVAKRFFRDTDSLSIQTKKPITPKEQEVRSNPRARSAKLRAAEKQTI